MDLHRPLTERHTEMKKLASALSKKLEAAETRATVAELARDKAEQAVRSLHRELASTRDTLHRAEALLQSLGHGGGDDGQRS